MAQGRSAAREPNLRVLVPPPGVGGGGVPPPSGGGGAPRPLAPGTLCVWLDAQCPPRGRPPPACRRGGVPELDLQFLGPKRLEKMPIVTIGGCRSREATLWPHWATRRILVTTPTSKGKNCAEPDRWAEPGCKSRRWMPTTGSVDCGSAAVGCLPAVGSAHAVGLLRVGASSYACARAAEPSCSVGAASRLRPGVLLKDYQEETGRVMEKELIGLGLLDADEVAEQDPEKPLYKKYFMHGTSHHLGLDVHDVGPTWQPVQAGMVFTIEPGIYIREENLGVRLENDVFIGENENVDLMADIPIQPDEIEALMRS